MTSRRVSILTKRLGADHVASLSKLVGGTQISVPDNLTASVFNAGRLRNRIGDTLFALLVFHFGGTRIYVPKGGATTATGITLRQVARMSRDGKSARAIALHYGCSDRTIYTKRAQIRARTKTKRSTTNERN